MEAATGAATGVDRSAARAIGLAVAVAIGVATGAAESRAIGAIAFSTWDGGGANAVVGVGGTATASGQGALAASMANNPALNGSAWAHTGAWWSVYLDAAPTVSISVTARDALQLAPGLAVWASGANEFDGGTTAFGGETSTAGFGTPHSFNAYGALGDAGTLWMQDGQGGNMLELLGYAISGPSVVGATGWGETILNGAHDLTPDDLFATSVGGSTGAGFAELVLSDVQAGWYSIYVGGTDAALSGGLFDLQVAVVPEPSTALLVGVGLLGLRVARKRG